MRKCEVDGCTGQHRARGFCILHYNNWVRYQSGVGKFEAKFRAAERERILAAVEKLRPHIDENGVNWIPQFNTIIKAIKGENK
jgi:hypothetical protein